MSTQQPGGGQPIGQLSPDGNWRWDGHNWVPAHQPQQGASGQAPWPQAPQQQYPQQQYGGMPPYSAPPKKGLPTWAKILIGVLVLFVGLIILLTIVGLAVDSNDYTDWTCEDVAKEAVQISDDNEGMLVLTGVTDLEIVEDNREDFTPPETGRGVVLSCEGTGSWDGIDDTPVLVELAASDDGDEWVRYEMQD